MQGLTVEFDMTSWKDMDDQVPGGVYLCQVSENVSCGACCGLYNVPDPSRDALEKMLVRRTTLFETVPRNWEDIEDFGSQMAAEASENRSFPEFHHCPYIGLIPSDRSRVGCLLHPLTDGNSGVDFRGLSYYGGMACRLYFCPTFIKVPELLKKLIRHSATDWYHYGLIITETDLLCAVFNELRSIRSSDLKNLHRFDNPPSLDCIRQLINLKLTWPFQPFPETDRVNYFFEDGLYAKPPVSYNGNGLTLPRFDEIFKNLVSMFQTDEHLNRAEVMIERLITDIAGIL